MLAPNNNRGVTHQTDKKHLNSMSKYFVGVVNIAFNHYLLIPQSLLTESSKKVARKAVFFSRSIRSSSVTYVHALYTGASQCIANRSDSSMFVVGF